MSKAEQRANQQFDTMWHFLEIGAQKANYPQLKEFVLQLRKMMMQKTAGQRKEKPNDLDFMDLDMLKNFIVIEAMALVLSGEYEPKDGDSNAINP